MKLTKIGDFLNRSKIPMDILDNEEYKRVTIRINHNGVSLRDSEIGKKIGTKKQFILKAGQFIVSKIDARYGAFGIAPDEVDGAIITGNFWAYDVDFSKLNIEWFNQFTNSPDFYDLCERASAGITHRKYLNESFFLNYEILLPSVEEQLIQIEKIKKQKLSFGELTAELTHQFDLIKQLRQAFLREAMQGKLLAPSLLERAGGEAKTGHDLLAKIKAEKAKLIAEKKLKNEKELPPITEDEIPFEIPEHWAWCRLGEVVNEILGGYAFDSTKYSKTETNNQVIRLGNVKPNQLVLDTNPVFIDNDYADEANKSKLEIGDILITMTGTRAKRDYLFSLCLTEDDLKTKNLYLNQRVGCFRFPKSISINFINVLLKDSKIIEPIFESSTGAANQANIGITALREMIIPLPPLHEQEQIVAKLEELMAFCDGLEESIKESQGFNEKLLQQVLREALQPKAVV